LALKLKFKLVQLIKNVSSSLQDKQKEITIALQRTKGKSRIIWKFPASPAILLACNGTNAENEKTNQKLSEEQRLKKNLKNVF
jgi:hypothetical protein